jgi:osmotically-inducible protein OsmY
MTTTQNRSDADLHRAVTWELEWHPRVESKGIAVSVKDGLVTLAGSVESYAMKIAACDATHQVAGVLDVADELQIKSNGAATSDIELARAVRHTLTWDVYVPDKRIKSTVSDGWVTLEGDVDRATEREDAARAIEHLSGVLGVTNRILVKPNRADSRQIQSSIEAALSRRAKREALGIRVTVSGTTVTLSGVVDSWGEKRALERIASCSTGVTKVVNEITVAPYS